MQATDDMPRARSRRKGRAKEPLPSPGAFDEELREALWLLLSLPRLYRRALDEGGWPPGGSGLHTTGGDPSDATLAAVTGKEQRQRRQDARTSVKWLRQALADVKKAEAALRGEPVSQPERIDARATMSQQEFDRRRRVHREREEQLRR